MAKKKISSVLTEETSKPSFAAKDVFLATLGFYGMLYEEGSEQLKSLKAKRDKQYHSLITRGGEIEAKAKEKYETFRHEDNRINARINGLRDSYQKMTGAFHKKVVVTVEDSETGAAA